ncbi:MAG: 5'/3'-nucleotidase SurE [Pseudomonadota bacterium]
MRILVTNDDSCDSPLLALLIERLAPYGTLHLVAPAAEQSWRGKSMTRYGTLKVEPIRIAGLDGHSVTGTPADCTNLGIFELLPEKPDLVVSGINIGSNVSLGFAMASGTLGACLEGNIAGIPGLALSQALAPEVYQQWSQHRRFDPAELDRLGAQLDAALPRIWARCVAPPGGDSTPTTMSVNLPPVMTDPEPVATRLAASSYGGCFVTNDDGFHHRIRRLDIAEDPSGDAAAVNSGRVSATLLDVAVLGQAPALFGAPPAAGPQNRA